MNTLPRHWNTWYRCIFIKLAYRLYSFWLLINNNNNNNNNNLFSFGPRTKINLNCVTFRLTTYKELRHAYRICVWKPQRQRQLKDISVDERIAPFWHEGRQWFTGLNWVVQERTSDGAVVNPRIKFSVSIIVGCIFTKGVSVECQRRFCIMDSITPFLSDGATSSCSLVRKYHLVYSEDSVLHIGTNKFFNLFKLFRKKYTVFSHVWK